MSPTAAEETQKPKLSKKLLGDCGIFFYESVCGDEDLDEWLISIRDQLIRLRRKLPDDVEEEFAEELDIFRTSGQDSAEAFESGWSLMPPDTQSEPAYFRRRVNETDPSVKRIDIEINVCRRIATEARLWRVRNEQESTWVSFLQEHFFRPYYKVHNNPNSHEDAFQRWELSVTPNIHAISEIDFDYRHQNLYWSEISSKTIMNPRAQKLTAPKPDFTYAFPIIDTTRKENLSYMRFSQADSFTLPVLGRLRKEYGLKSAPTTRLQMWAAENDVALDAADLICFPWAVVEAKRNKKTETPDIKFKKYNRKVAGTNKSMERFCYCQAANASAEALTLREELAAKAKEQSESHYALVIISITCVGSSIKVWITYRRNSNKDSSIKKGPITMVCIWATSLELIWGALSLRMVMKNMRQWVYGDVKHEISRWIGSVRKNSSQQTSLTPVGEKVVRARRAASCGPLSDRTNHTSLDYEGTPLRTKAPPILSRGETAPEYFGQRKFKDIPILKLNDSVVRKIYYGRSDDDYKETSEIGEDEGFASDGTEEDHTKQNEDESSSEYNSPIEEYNIESLSELESLDTQSSEERDEKEESGEADDGDEVSDDDDSEDEDEDSYCIDEQPYKPHTALLQSPRFHSNPAEVSDDDDDEDDEDYSEDDEDDSEDDEDDSEDDKDDSEDDEDDSEDDEDDSEDDEDDSEDEDDDSEDNDEDDEDNSEDEDEDFYCIDEQPHKPHTTLRRSPRFNNTPKG